MLKRVNGREDTQGAQVKLRDASFPSPFASGLEYSSPARGSWNIVHTAMLLPGGHQIYVCAAGCLRGVILTAAEMNATDRFSTIAIREHNLIDGDMEDLIVDGVADVLARLPKKPPAVMIYTSCIHHFMGCDLPLAYKKLRERFPDTGFSECFMNPIMRKSGLTPDQLTRRQLYSFLEPRPIDPRAINIIGNDLATEEDSELVRMIRQAGYTLRDITWCKTYEEYQQMAAAALNITYNPAAIAACDVLKRRLGQEHMHLPISYNYDEITANLNRLADYLGIDHSDYAEEISRCREALAAAKAVIGDAPIAIDYTATFRPFSLARLLVDSGFNVTRIYVDSISGEDKGDFEYLQQHRPDMDVFATVHAKMRFVGRTTEGKTLAIGQKAAYFTGTDYFVNFVESGGYYGFHGICSIAALMEEAFLHEKDAERLIQMKGWGCESCL